MNIGNKFKMYQKPLYLNIERTLNQFSEKEIPIPGIYSISSFTVR